jgi:hypothetical protein
MTDLNTEEINIKNIINSIVVESQLNIDVEECSIDSQRGGLFNIVYKVQSECDIWFFKRYVDAKVSTVFSPPEIPANLRAELAYRTHILCRNESLEHNHVPAVYLHQDTNSLLIRGIPNGVDFIEMLASGLNVNRIVSCINDIATCLACLHRVSYLNSYYIEEPLFCNTRFRDFKLEIQYDHIAAKLGGPLGKSIIDLVKRYKCQYLSVLHGDINSRNIILNSIVDEEVGVIDFEQSHVGNPIYDMAYILSEIFISGISNDLDLKKLVYVFFNSYIISFPGFPIGKYKNDFVLHLATQIIYRFLGPSHNSWTYYVGELQKITIMDYAINMLKTGSDSIVDSVFIECSNLK